MNEWHEFGQSFNNSEVFLLLYYYDILSLAHFVLFTHSDFHIHTHTHIRVHIKSTSCVRLFYGRSHNTYLEWIIFIECDYFQHFAKTLEYLMQNVQRNGIQKRLDYHT